ncbi:MAG: 7-carboxy-7-deazaguanine synthase [Candidatus Sumerlaeia bacterium]
MGYAVKEIFYSLQGEGMHVGTPAVFCRFSGCNLWTGRNSDLSDAMCKFCDTNFVGTNGPGGGFYDSPEALTRAIQDAWPSVAETPYDRLVVCTGGEPTLQIDEKLVAMLQAAGFEVMLETNGTLPAPENVDWVCVSPKGGTELKQTWGDELKLVYPQPDADPELYENFDFFHFYLQPMDGPELEQNTRLAMKYCLEHPVWKLSIQLHKILGIP